MAKRGDTRPWRIRYEWDNGIKGTETRETFERAQDFASQMERYATTRGRVTVTIQHRDSPRPAAAFTYGTGSS